MMEETAYHEYNILSEGIGIQQEKCWLCLKMYAQIQSMRSQLCVH